MRIGHLAWLAGLGALLAGGQAAALDCTRDTDCPGDQICEDDLCIGTSSEGVSTGFLHADPALALYADGILEAFRDEGAAAAGDLAARDPELHEEFVWELGQRIDALEDYLIGDLGRRAIRALPDAEVRPIKDDLDGLWELVRREGVPVSGSERWAELKRTGYQDLREAVSPGAVPGRLEDPRPVAWATLAPQVGLAGISDGQLWLTSTLAGVGEVRPRGRVGRILCISWEAAGGPAWGLVDNDRLASGFGHVRATLGFGGARHWRIYDTTVRSARAGEYQVSWHAPRYAALTTNFIQGYLGPQFNVWPDGSPELSLSFGFRYSATSGFRWTKVLPHDRTVRYRTRVILLDAFFLLGQSLEDGGASAGLGVAAQVSAGAYALRLNASFLDEGWAQVGLTLVGGNLSSPSVRQVHPLHESGDWPAMLAMTR